MLNITLDCQPFEGRCNLKYTAIAHEKDNPNEVFVVLFYEFDGVAYTVASENLVVKDAPNLTLEENSKLLGFALHALVSNINKHLG